MKDRDGVVRRLALAGVIISDAALSYSILHARADHIGFASWATWLYPIGLDALIVGASRTWQNADLSKSTRRLARWTTLLSVAFGMAGFIAEFYPRGWSAVAYSLFVPASLAAALIITSRAAADRKANAARTQDQPDAKDDGGAEPEPRSHELLVEDVATAFDVPVELLETRVDHVTGTLTNKNTIEVDLTGVEFDHATKTTEFVAPDIVSRGGALHVVTARDEQHEVRAPVTPPIVPQEPAQPGDDEQPASPEVRKQWIRDQLAAGKNVTGADVDRQFPGGSRNGARLVRQVKEERGPRA